MAVDYLDQLNETADLLKSRGFSGPKTAIILGTGLGAFGQHISNPKEIVYQEIPHFPTTTLKAHNGKLITGQMDGAPVLALSGRFHFYEGYSMSEVTYPIRVLQKLGVENLIISNAAGGLNPAFETGDLMIIRDHINLMPEHPLRGKNHDEIGPRYPDMKSAYHQPWIETSLKFARDEKIRCHSGVYIVVQGPSLETPAEFRFLHTIGADAVGMSTVPEVIVARHCGLKVFAISAISNMGFPPEKNEEITEAKVIAMAQKIEPQMSAIVKHLIAEM